jgi:hypothetical protein
MKSTLRTSGRKVSQLSGFSPVSSVYNIPFVDSFYKPGSLHYATTPINGDFRTTDVFYDPSRSGNRGQRGSDEFSNDGDESDEKAKNSRSGGANENFAITAVLLLTGGFFLFKFGSK